MVSSSRIAASAADAAARAALSSSDPLRVFASPATIISNDVALIPLYFQVSAWAVKKGITYVGRGDERTYAYNFKPK